jgi:hypothetical protein
MAARTRIPKTDLIGIHLALVGLFDLLGTAPPANDEAPQRATPSRRVDAKPERDRSRLPADGARR